MPNETLRALLARVHEHLSSTSSVDPESREMLTTVVRDINARLSQSNTGAAVPSPAAIPTPPLPPLEALAVRFESNHPAIAQLLRQIGALLGQAGI